MVVLGNNLEKGYLQLEVAPLSHNFRKGYNPHPSERYGIPGEGQVSIKKFSIDPKHAYETPKAHLLHGQKMAADKLSMLREDIESTCPLLDSWFGKPLICTLDGGPLDRKADMEGTCPFVISYFNHKSLIVR